MTTPALVRAFYEHIWNAGELDAAEFLLAHDITFRGSLGAALDGRDAFLGYVRSVRGALADYRCEILDCVAEDDRAFARMRFAGRHTGPFRGFAPTGQEVSWLGAAWFRFRGERIAEIWVLGDLLTLDSLLSAQAGAD